MDMAALFTKSIPNQQDFIAVVHSDEALFKQPPQNEDCTICCIQLPALWSGSKYMSCCGKEICSGCQKRAGGSLCPFCRTPAPKAEEQIVIVTRNKKRMIEKDDAYAIHNMGSYYHDGSYGMQQNRAKALELWHRSGELGYAGSYHKVPRDEWLQIMRVDVKDTASLYFGWCRDIKSCQTIINQHRLDRCRASSYHYLQYHTYISIDGSILCSVVVFTVARDTQLLIDHINMKLLSIALVYTAATITTAIANDDNKTNNNSLLRGPSSLSPRLISNQWDDGCTPDGSLQPNARNGLTMEQICARNYGHTMYPHKHFIVPYKCSGPAGGGYACCVDDLGDSTDQSSVGLGTCTKASSSEDNSDNNRSTSSTNGDCKPDGSLDPRTMYRSGHGMSPHDLCAQHHKGTGFTEPYTCSSGAGYACCTSNSGDIVEPGKGLGMCSPRDHDTKDDNSDNNRSPSSGGQCTPDGSLNPRSRAQRGISATSICQEKDGFPVPYSCTGHGGPMQGGYACCTSDSDDEVTDPGHGLGRCTKLPKMSNGKLPQDEEKEVVYDEEEGRHPLGCMCMNSRMMPQRGQCCGKCDDGMCPASDVRCQGCDDEESGDTEEGQCEVDNSLHPRSRRHTMRSPSQVCEEESTATGSSYTIPYKCTGNGPLLYACCETGLGDEMTTSLEGKTKTCTKEEDDMSAEEVLVAYE